MGLGSLQRLPETTTMVIDGEGWWRRMVVLMWLSGTNAGLIINCHLSAFEERFDFTIRNADVASIYLASFSDCSDDTCR
ncbi:hypothetical protein HanXRQr2_Chr07g0297221 [Helianthus annuus]|uniref:Uncharacterized protein n=1 Tax=Helianthus annuus TaxID=4232 RepID=A0A9K3IKY0_HELAN|nr:hypothetical protein HanXRQr2_Chr17g0817151 [Helianthus annuus]KAF5798806.1 hypothetical protein HanXRQr2_Chr07g0297221 [Helianthus annuus]KAJ0904907.1 hypothetical protein HanPSC8_Chr07g0287741 [Helianthus annuus]